MGKIVLNVEEEFSRLIITCMKKMIVLLPGIFLFVSRSQGQGLVTEPQDYLSPDFHKQRREVFRKSLPESSVAVFFAAPVRNRANDTDFLYHQDPDFYYLTGLTEPNAVLLISSENEAGFPDELLFVQPRDPLTEMWNGRRLGVKGAKEKLGFQQVLLNSQFKELDLQAFDHIYFKAFDDDVRNTEDEADLFDLIAFFKNAIDYPGSEPKLNSTAIDSTMDVLRGIKTPEELTLLKRAIEISCVGQVEVMKAMKPGISELEIQGIHEFVYKKYGAEYEGYNSIVGAGENGCVLHYVENKKPAVGKQELVLMDVGAEYHGYTADITRTIPASGKFTKEQLAIYKLVYEAQEAVFKAIKPGVRFSRLNAISHEVINEGLVKLGIIDSDSTQHLYYPHSFGHHIGLDVHDRGRYDVVQENMVFTVEPGIYIPEDSPCEAKWKGIAVRIEDNVLATADGMELLSGRAPRKAEEIEAMMRQTSALDDFVLPELKH